MTGTVDFQEQMSKEYCGKSHAGFALVTMYLGPPLVVITDVLHLFQGHMSTATVLHWARVLPQFAVAAIGETVGFRWHLEGNHPAAEHGVGHSKACHFCEY